MNKMTRKSQNILFLIALTVCAVVFTGGCITGGESPPPTPEKPQIKSSPTGLTPIGVKKYTTVDLGEHALFEFKLRSGRAYEFLLNYVDDGDKYTSSPNKVDNNLFLMDAEGRLLKTSTESVGLPQRIEFTPKETATYYLLIVNNAQESKGVWPVTLISAEKYVDGMEAYIEGRDTNTNNEKYNTYYSVWLSNETTSATKLIHMSVPETLDMYQARLLCIDGGVNETSGRIIHLKYDPESETAPKDNIYASGKTMGTDLDLELSYSERNKNCILQLIGEWGQGVMTIELK